MQVMQEIYSQKANKQTPLAIAMGVGIGFIGSIVTVRKHLRV